MLNQGAWYVFGKDNSGVAMNRLAVGAIAGCTLLIGNALAADLGTVVVDTPALQQSAITGFYAGINAGYAFEGVRYNKYNADPFEAYDFALDPGVFGVSAGYDTTIAGNVIVGAELRYDYLNADFTPYEDSVCCSFFKMRDSITAVAKVGYLVSPSTQLYAVLGAGSVYVTAPESYYDFKSGGVMGYVAGIGAETRLTDLLTASVDARYFRSTDEFEVNEIEGFEPRYFMVTAGLKMRFDQPQVAVKGDPRGAGLTFTGFNMGVSAGGYVGALTRTVETPGAEVGPFWAENYTLGLNVGYDVELGGGYVLGFDASYDSGRLDFYDPSQDSPFPDATTLFGTVTDIIAATARFGIKTDPSTLIYAKAGFAGMTTNANPDFFALEGGYTQFLGGYQLGIGLETAIAEKTTLTFEGLYTKATETLITENTQADQIGLQPAILQGKVGLKIHF